MASPSSPHEDEEKDSLFSVESQEKVTISETPEEVDKKLPTPEYSDDDLLQLIDFIKNIVTLYDLKSSDWTEDNDEVIKQYLLNPDEVLLTVFFQGDILTCTLGLPETQVVDMTYFMRSLHHEIYQTETFHDQIIFGTIDDNIEGTILDVIENVYAPVFFKTDSWPESVRNDFCHNMHMFLAKMTDIHNKLFGLTVLYIPKEAKDLTVDMASKDKELVKRLEAIVVYWTKQIRVGLQDQDQNTPDDLLCLTDEYEFWIYRYENLCGLSYQLSNKTLKQVCDILVAVQSTYVRQFLLLNDEIDRNVKEAKSNVEYLSVLKDPAFELSKVLDPQSIPDHLMKILHLIRFIWINSPYYNTAEKITTLCRSLSNQVIIQCIKYINLDLVFMAKKSREAIKMFETCIDGLTRYIRIYVLASGSQTEFSMKPWTLDQAPIFNHVDSFIHRCKDMIEICEAMIHFGRHDETETIPKPMFGSCRYQEFENWCTKIEDMFAESLKAVKGVRHIIFDVQVAEWYDHMLQFKNRMKDIEIVIENLTNAVFDEAANVEDGVESLAAFHNYSKRESIRPLFEAKTLQVYEMFKQEIHDCKMDLANDNDHPGRLPYYAGRAMLADMKKNRLEILKKMFDEANWMLPCSLSKEIFAQYDKLVKSIDERILGIYRKWVDRLGEDIAKRLDRPLMCRSISKPGLLECNIDRSLLDIFREVQYWETLKYEVPPHVKSVHQKSANVKFVYEIVLSVVMDYNKIVASLSDEERLLFKPLITLVEKKISPGLSKLTWASEVGDEYIAECSHNTAEVSIVETIDDYYK